MKFLIDAQLPRRFCDWLALAGHDALHTLDLPMGNRTTDAEIIEFADGQDRIVVTKDDDFVQSHLVHGQPRRLLLVATGNISNRELEILMNKNLLNITTALDTSHYVEVGREKLVCHG
ncbi:DUF5615 family PIN-like protein [Candidatus Symbiobacter mobilis]|uniref:DUF5615 domain-containing protein n=1 Tax=Candidatus Symbiobacter mobilis CR TaxID=946483 RepID=U5NEK7_9BURK|nr:DUF5615 family PIN-like protein [Candidatus Symbiobacter mobilis]AGX88589.1 hypothetical protein Cenrod_2535 [Candidatus Symbiobacter mobilis CR]